MPDKVGKWFIRHIRQQRLLAREYFLRGKERRSRRSDSINNRRRSSLKVVRTSGGGPKFEAKGVGIFRKEY
ncbi:MAG: hypothetical protein A6F71_08165 [Cycloclasticus sp. symbiont of Poecilosclerida sp. M]|nr:MAG: hypothetical protein A6F71_08165 [Cycloclasticus sp. symbiont of Poecilosclerida sp. M]